MPFGVQVRIERPVTPVPFACCGSETFEDWEAYRAYETSEIFLAYYRERWKPAVTAATEHLMVLDTAEESD